MMENKFSTKRKIYSVIISLSSFFFFAFVSRTSLTHLIFAFFLGIFTSVLVFKIPNIIERYERVSNPEKIICLFVSIGVLFELSFRFFEKWKVSSTVKKIAGSLFQNEEYGLKVIDISVATFSFPFLFLLSCCLLSILFSLFRVIPIKKSFRCVVENIKARNVLFCIFNVFLASVLGMVLLVTAYKIPTAPIENNVAISAINWEKEGAYPRIYPWCQSQLDNFTDAIMLLEATNDKEDSSLNKAIYAYRGTIKNLDTPYDVLISHFNDGQNFTDEITYPRYWHGYQIFLKPLLSAMTYQNIRTVNLFVQIGLSGVLCFLMAKRNLKEYIIPYIIAYLMLAPTVLAKSLQFSSCYYVYVIASIVILLISNKKRRKIETILFLNFGIFTSYFDFLTYPVITFAVPTLLCLLLDDADVLERKIGNLIKNGISWCFGYVGMWSMKWIISSLLTETNVIFNAFEAIASRTSHSYGTEHFSTVECISKNIYTFCRTPFFLLAILIVVYTIWKLRKRENIDCESVIKKIVPFFTVALIPILWYILVTNHSTIHFWFTNKDCMILILSILFLCVRVLSYLKGEPRCKV